MEGEGVEEKEKDGQKRSKASGVASKAGAFVLKVRRALSAAARPGAAEAGQRPPPPPSSTPPSSASLLPPPSLPAIESTPSQRLIVAPRAESEEGSKTEPES